MPLLESRQSKEAKVADKISDFDTEDHSLYLIDSQS